MVTEEPRVSLVEIPLLRESRSFARRLEIGVLAHGGGVYHRARRTNWSYRNSTAFYLKEAQLFTAQPDRYLAGKETEPPEIEDVYVQTLGWRELVKVFLKVAAHWLFLILGAASRARARKQPFTTLRKGYVEDIELVFDPEAPHVLRLIFPFPLSVKRQRRYLTRLRREGRPFALCGAPYSIADVLQVMRWRTTGAVQRLETRAQLRLARHLARFQARVMEVSDEFDIGCLDFCRMLHRLGFEVVNSAHGVGKYLPVHAFDHFSILTKQQEEYYIALRPCSYVRRSLNGQPPPPMPAQPSDPLNLVILGQAAAHVSPILQDAEKDLLRQVDLHFKESTGLTCYYKPHPNNAAVNVHLDSITILNDLTGINGHPKTIFCSFFSTCQVDPAFAGKKYLLRAPLIYPEIAFDDDQPILDIKDFIFLVLEDLLENRLAGQTDT